MSSEIVFNVTFLQFFHSHWKPLLFLGVDCHSLSFRFVWLRICWVKMSKDKQKLSCNDFFLLCRELSFWYVLPWNELWSPLLTASIRWWVSEHLLVPYLKLCSCLLFIYGFVDELWHLLLVNGHPWCVYSWADLGGVTACLVHHVAFHSFVILHWRMSEDETAKEHDQVVKLSF